MMRAIAQPASLLGGECLLHSVLPKPVFERIGA
jgi:hypothetical protein